ncbi:MAG TPA: MATE family efflux transporter [Candidatus Anaerobutyricum stercoripullorum]|uniref:MATE family efflux transporter n=1 Tax=Candidatus Anaerobutyricum stercoripullorum TaxID=2838456 RepID=A0A9D2BEE3_9FIRM|nr:MATE family efflux transporter [Candidatus Anaerobutyricum stercoripullorum]
MTKDMTEGNPLLLILKFTLPLLAGNLLQQGYNVADAAIVGRFLGTNALAGVGASSSVQFLILGFCIGTCTGFCVPVAQRFGAGDYSTMRRFVFNSFIITAVIAVVLTALCAIFCTQIVELLATPDDIFDDAYIYLLVILLGIPFTLLYNLTSSIMRAVGDSRTPFLFLAFACFANIFLDIFCITTLHWGVAGAAIATITSQLMSGVLCLVYMMKKYPVLHMEKEECHVQGNLVKNLIVMGFPMGLQFSITAIGSMVMQAATNNLGSVYVSANTAASRLKNFTMCPFDAIAAAVSTFCGQNYGAKKMDRIRQGLRQGVLAGIIYGIVIGIVVIVFGRQMSMIFVDGSETAVLDASRDMLFYSGFFYWILGILIIVRLCVQGLGYSGRAVLSGVVEMIARTVVSILCVPVWGFLAICFTDQAAWVTAVCYIVPMCIYCLKKVEKILGEGDADGVQSSHGA